VLVVEDEQKMANALREGLEADDYAVSVAHTGEEGFYLAQSKIFDMMDTSNTHKGMIGPQEMFATGGANRH